MEDGTSIGNALEMRPSGRNEGPTMVVVNESSKLSLYDDGEECKEQKIDHLVANEQAKKCLQRTTSKLRDSEMMEDILRGSGVCVESGGRITFYPNTAKNRPM